MMNHGMPRGTTRRQALCQAGTGLGMLGLCGLLGDSGYLGPAAARADVVDTQKGGSPVRGSLTPRPPHFPARAAVRAKISLTSMPLWPYF
jgi:hypothetical protein